jgi:DNA-binding CsgD family transcriptional regulator
MPAISSLLVWTARSIRLAPAHVDPWVAGIFHAAHTRKVAAVRWQVDRLAEDVALLGSRALPREQYFAEVGARLRRVVDADATCWHTLDPDTQLLTSDAPAELISAGVYTAESAAAAGERIVASEYLTADVNTFASLARRRVPVGILSEATRGHPEQSTRYRELLVDSGIPFEMRAAFVSRGRAWGAVHVARKDDKRDFTREDAQALARITTTVADGIRASLRFDAARRGDGAAPGLVVLGPGNEIELITGPARALFAEMQSEPVRDRSETPPAALLALASFARTDPEHVRDPVVVPTGSGWISMHASLPEGRAAGRVAIVLDRASGPRVAALRLEVHGATPRERETAALLARGLTNPEIASALVVSPYTVQDHIKSLFEKTGASSRQDLVARIFLEAYLPNVAQRAPLAADGGFAVGS